MGANPWLLVLLLAMFFWAGMLTERLLARARQSRGSAENIRKLEAGEYGERLREKWEKLKREDR